VCPRAPWDSTAAAWVRTEKRLYVYDGWLLVAELLADSQGGVTPAVTYLWGPDLSGTVGGAGGVGGLVAVTVHGVGTQPATYLPGYDGNGNVVAYVRAESATVAATFELAPFGGVLAEWYSDDVAKGALRGAPRFATRFFDSDTGLYYFGYRWYDPDTGRFLCRDPLREAGGLNLYAYCQNDPINAVDPLGLAWWNPRAGDFLFWRGVRGAGVMLAKGGRQVAKVTFGAYRLTGYYGFFYWVGGDYLDPGLAEPTQPGDPSSCDVIFTVNGILTDRAGALRILNEGIAEGRFKTGLAIVNPTTQDDPVQSWLRHVPLVGPPTNAVLAASRDVVQTVGEKLYMPDRTAELASQTIESYAGNHPEDRVHSLHVFSQGGAIGTCISLSLPDDIKSQMQYFTYGSASGPVLGWQRQVHDMNWFDPVPHLAGRGLLFLPVALIDALRPSVHQNWHLFDQKGTGVPFKWWYHSWFPSYEDKPARTP
jgi:RHS repeat-associated protein